MSSRQVARIPANNADGIRARLDALQRAGDHLASLNDPDLAQVGRSLVAWREGGAAGSLDEALGLRRRGGVSPPRALAIGVRDALLRTLAREHPDYAGLDPVRVAPHMLAAFNRYEAGRWLRDRSLDTEPPSEPAATFWRLLRAGLTMPKAKQLRSILDRETEGSSDG